MKPLAHYRRPKSCQFCGVTSGEVKTAVLYETHQLIAFADRSPAALGHVLVIPREHIRNVNSLKHRDLELVESMASFGKEVLDREFPGAQQKYGFHKPPFTSVDHLHMHCLALPFRSCLGLKYWLPLNWITADDVISTLGRLRQQAQAQASDDNMGSSV